MSLNTLSKIRLARAASRLLKLIQFWNHGKSHRIAKRGNLVWSLDLDEGIDLAIYLYGAFERSTVRAYSRVLKPGHTVFDIGANCGAHTLHFAQLVGNRGRVVAFEPTNYAFERIQTNLRMNPSLMDHVELHQMALTDLQNASSRTELYASWPLIGKDNLHATHGGRLHGTAGAQFMSLDKFTLQNKIERLDFIKLDVDGDEPRIISGGLRTLEEFHPSILMEWCPALFLEPIRDASEIQASLAGLGYGVSIVSHRGIQPSNWGVIAKKLPTHGSVNLLLQSSKQRTTTTIL